MLSLGTASVLLSSSGHPAGRAAVSLTSAMSKHIKGSKERYLLGQNTTCQFSE